jgi:hypothetical protein
MNHGNNFDTTIHNFKKEFRIQPVIVWTDELKEEKGEEIEEKEEKEKESPILALLSPKKKEMYKQAKKKFQMKKIPTSSKKEPVSSTKLKTPFSNLIKELKKRSLLQKKESSKEEKEEELSFEDIEKEEKGENSKQKGLWDD